MELSEYIKYQKRIINLYDYSEDHNDRYIFYDCYLNEIDCIDYCHAYKVEIIKTDSKFCIVNIFKDPTNFDSITIE